MPSRIYSHFFLFTKHTPSLSPMSSTHSPPSAHPPHVLCPHTISYALPYLPMSSLHTPSCMSSLHTPSPMSSLHASPQISYFGLQYQTKWESLRWVDREKPLRKQLEKYAIDGARNAELRFRVQYYVTTVTKLQYEITRCRDTLFDSSGYVPIT